MPEGKLPKHIFQRKAGRKETAESWQTDIDNVDWKKTYRMIDMNGIWYRKRGYGMTEMNVDWVSEACYGKTDIKKKINSLF